MRIQGTFSKSFLDIGMVSYREARVLIRNRSTDIQTDGRSWFSEVSGHSSCLQISDLSLEQA